MGESTRNLLSKVEAALWLGDKRMAGLLLHQVLLQDFANRQAWLLLHGMRGTGQSLETFQRSFAQKYYPNLAHLLDQPPADIAAQTEADAPGFLSTVPSPEETEFCATCGTALLPQAKFCPYCGAPVLRAGEPMPGAPAAAEAPEAVEAAEDAEAPAPSEGLELPAKAAPAPEPWAAFPEDQPASPEPEQGTAERRPYCPACHKIFPPDVLFCDTCGAPLFQMVEALPDEPIPAPVQAAGQLADANLTSAAVPGPAPAPGTPLAQPPPGEGTVLIYRKKSPILEDKTFSIWIDGAFQDELANHQKRSYILPAGAHTIEMVSEQRSSDPVTIDLQANGTVRLSCQPVGTSPDIIRPALKVIPTRAASKTSSRPLPTSLKVLLLALLFFLFLAGIGMIVLFLINQGLL